MQLQACVEHPFLAFVDGGAVWRVLVSPHQLAVCEGWVQPVVEPRHNVRRFLGQEGREKQHVEAHVVRPISKQISVNMSKEGGDKDREDGMNKFEELQGPM